MTDLRDRIAAVLYSSFATELWGDYALGWKNESDYVKADYLDVADAVIRELDAMGIIHLSRIVGCQTGPVGHKGECR